MKKPYGLLRGLYSWNPGPYDLVPRDLKLSETLIFHFKISFELK